MTIPANLFRSAVCTMSVLLACAGLASAVPVLSLDPTFSMEGQPSDAGPQLLPLKFRLSEAHKQMVYVNYTPTCSTGPPKAC